MLAGEPVAGEVGKGDAEGEGELVEADEHAA